MLVPRLYQILLVLRQIFVAAWLLSEEKSNRRKERERGNCVGVWLLSEERSKRRKERRKVRVRGHTPVDQGGRGVREANRRLSMNTRRKADGEGLKERLEGKKRMMRGRKLGMEKEEAMKQGVTVWS